ncbi:MAG: hypothetical protein HZC36_07860 [Armatimonadetes bacterium]|nr:hypothetical protein [Armatimonadota bacterium]
MKLSKIFAIAALIAAAVAPVSAQGFRMMGGGGAGSPLNIMFSFNFQDREFTVRSDVSKELKLTDDQKSKLLAWNQAQMESMRGSFQPGGQPPSQEEMQAMAKKRAEAEAKITKEVLDETQAKRLRELWVQRTGNAIILNADVQKELGITDDQKKKAADLQKRQGEANQSIMQKARDGEIEFSEVRDLMAKNTKALNDELGKILTKEQADRLKAMGGAPFKFDPDNFGG